MALEFWFDKLTYREKKWIANGCGAKGGWVPVPEFGLDHRRACLVHDLLYWVGHTEQDRLNADRRFLHSLLRGAMRRPWWSRGFCVAMAWAYYRAVRAFGKNAFHYGPRDRTHEDLKVEMAR